MAATIFISANGCVSAGITSEKARAMSSPAFGEEEFARSHRGEGINIGDQIQLSVLGYPEFNLTTTVKESGTIALPLVGDITAVGLTKKQLEEQIVTKLSEFVKTSVYVTVSITSAAVQNIIVLGQVSNQGSYPATSPLSIFQVFANAGGLAEQADLRHVKVYRGGDLRREVEIDLSGVVAPGTAAGDRAPTVSPGDLVYVPKSENFFREFSPFIYDILVLLTLFSLVS
jgi:polysaccharide export outer membrane protein